MDFDLHFSLIIKIKIFTPTSGSRNPFSLLHAHNRRILINLCRKLMTSGGFREIKICAGMRRHRHVLIPVADSAITLFALTSVLIR